MAIIAAMKPAAYLSNISPLWPLARQEAALAQAVPPWPRSVRLYRDVLGAQARRAHLPSSLTDRAAMLAAAGPAGGGEIFVASLAPLAWAVEDMLDVATLLAVSRATLVVLDAGLRIGASADAVVLRAAVHAFAQARRARTAAEGGLSGGATSGRLRAAAAEAAARSVEREYALPSHEVSMETVLAKAGISRNTLIKYLGPREAAQQARKAVAAGRGSAGRRPCS